MSSLLNKEQLACLDVAQKTTSLGLAINRLKKLLPNFKIVFKQFFDLDGNGQHIERYGAFDPRTNVITINPLKDNHNPLEIVDTLAHEIVHALCIVPELQEILLPMGSTDLQHDKNVPKKENKFVKNAMIAFGMQDPYAPSQHQIYMETNYGPSHSNPLHEYIDINKPAQDWVARICRITLKYVYPHLSPSAEPTLTMKFH